MKIDVKNSSDIQELSELLSSLEQDIDVLISINKQIEDLKQKYQQNTLNAIDKIHLINSKFNLSDEDIIELHEIDVTYPPHNKKKYYDEYGRILKDLQKD